MTARHTESPGKLENHQFLILSHWVLLQYSSQGNVLKFSHGCYLFTVSNFSNSGLFFSHDQPYQQRSSCWAHFPPSATLNVDLWPWPSNLTYTVSWRTSTPTAKYLGQRLFSSDRTHLADCCTCTTKVGDQTVEYTYMNFYRVERIEGSRLRVAIHTLPSPPVLPNDSTTSTQI